MSSDQPYNELGQILANGGEIALGLAISKGWTGGQIALLFSRRFEPMTEPDRLRLHAIANAAIEAAAQINDLDDDDTINIDSIPTNPYLFGDDPAGRRGKVAGRFSVDNGANWFDLRVDVADISNKAAMFNEAEQTIQADWKKYPEKKQGGFGGSPITSLMIELTLVEKRF